MTSPNACARRLNRGCSQAGRAALRLACVAALLFLSACATVHAPPPATGRATGHAPGLGPWREVSARIAVLDGTRAWQAMLDWQASTPEAGRLRITHAASGTIVELQWQGSMMQLRDNRHPEWRPVKMEALAARGILLAPRELAALLLGHPPASFAPQGADAWMLRRDGARIRIRWNARRARLEMADLSHGRRAVLIITGHD